MSDDVGAQLDLIRKEAQKVIEACDARSVYVIQQSAKIINSAARTAMLCSGDTGEEGDDDMSEYMRAIE